MRSRWQLDGVEVAVRWLRGVTVRGVRGALSTPVDMHLVQGLGGIANGFDRDGWSGRIDAGVCARSGPGS